MHYRSILFEKFIKMFLKRGEKFLLEKKLQSMEQDYKKKIFLIPAYGVGDNKKSEDVL